MTGLLADVNAELHVEILLRICRGPRWQILWNALDVTVHSFHSLGIAKDAPDQVLWRLCQLRGLVLITANRNATGEDSLQGTILRENTEASLPVITIGDPVRLQHDGAYRQRAADRLVELLVDIEVTRGAGRLFIP
jgi:hypothetical protein